MSIQFRDDWETDNTATPKMSKNQVEDGVRAGLDSLNSLDVEFASLKSVGLSTSSLAKIYVSKGLHQEQGNQILANNHVTLEAPDYPNPKRFHMFFWYVTVNKVQGWHPNSVTYIRDNRVVSANL
jgi:hypothetical protein